MLRVAINISYEDCMFYIYRRLSFRSYLVFIAVAVCPDHKLRLTAMSTDNQSVSQ